MARLRVSRTSLLSVTGVRNVYDDSYFIEGDDRVTVRLSVRWCDRGNLGYIYYGMRVRIEQNTVMASELNVSQPYPFMLNSLHIGLGGIAPKLTTKWAEIPISGKHKEIKVGEIFSMQRGRGIIARL